MTRRHTFLSLAAVALLLAVASPIASSSAVSPTLQRDSEVSIREERAVRVESSDERWALQWLSTPEPVCTPEEDPESWTTCPCGGFAIGEQGHLALTRRRPDHEVEQLVLDPFFEAVVTGPGMAVLQ